MAYINPTDLQNPIVTQGKLGNTNAFPLLVAPEGEPGEEAYERELDELFRQLNQMMWGEVGKGANDERNPVTNYPLFEGYLDPARHQDALAPEGIQGISKLESGSFFAANEGILSGIFQEAGLNFATTTKGPAWEDARRERAVKAGTEKIMREAAKLAKEAGGQDVDEVMTDPSIYVPEDPTELLGKLPFQQQLEGEVYVRLEEDLELTNATTKLMDMLRDKFIVEKQIALISPRAGHAHLERLTIDQVGWWGKSGAKTAEDMDAVAIHDTLTPTGLLAEYGSMLTDEEVDIIQGRNLGVNPGMFPVRDWDRYTDTTLTSLMPDSRGNGPAKVKAMGPQGDLIRQRLYVRLLKFYHYLLLVDVDSEGNRVDLRELTEREAKDYAMGRYPFAERIQYMRLTKERAEQMKSTGSKSVRSIRTIDIWESVAFQDSMFGLPTNASALSSFTRDRYTPGIKVLYRRPMPWQEREPNRLTMPKLPVVIHFGSDESLVSKGRPLHEMYTNILIVLRRMVALAGSNAVGYDISQKPKGVSFEQIRFTAAQAGLYLFNGKRDSGGSGNRADNGHLRAINLSADNGIERMANLATMLRSMYDQLCGVNDALKGRFGARETAGQTQVGISRGMMATNRLFVENNAFVTEVFNRMVSVGKYLWPSSSSPRAKGATMEVVRQLPLNYYGVYLENSLKSQQDKDFIMEVAKQALSSGQASLSEIVRLRFAESPQEMLAIFEDGLSAFEKSQQELSKSQAETQQAMASAAQLKAMMPKTVAEIQVEGALDLERLRQGSLTERNSDNIRLAEDKSDIDQEAKARQTAAQMMQQNVDEGMTI